MMTKKSIPKTINILGHDWTIEFVDQKKMQGSIGSTHFPSRKIILSKDLKGSMLRMTFLHEFWHARQFESGWTQIMEPQAMELDCESFASIMTSCFNISIKKK